MRILGKQFGVELVHRSEEDFHVYVQLLGEDDGNWFKIGEPFSAFWLEDLAQTINSAQRMLAAQYDPAASGYGYQFRVNNAPQEKETKE